MGGGDGKIPRFDDINSTDAVGACNLIELLEELDRVGVGFTAFHIKLDGDAGLEGDRELGRDIGRIERIWVAQELARESTAVNRSQCSITYQQIWSRHPWAQLSRAFRGCPIRLRYVLYTC